MTGKFFAGLALALVMMLSLAGPVLAAPAVQEVTPITGTVQTIVVETDETTGVTTVVIEVLDDQGASQTLRLAVEDAVSLGLVTLDETTGEPLVDETAIGTEVSVDPALVIEEDSEADDEHPVGSKLSDFFADLVGVDYETVMEFHEDGVGFGVIAQALWMTNKLEGDSATFAAILEARQTGDYSGFDFPEGETPENWGQFRKAILDGDKHNNLGEVMSDKSDDGEEDDTGEEDEEGGALTPADEQNGNGQGNGNGNGNPDHGNKDKDKKNNGQNKKDHGNNKK
jgi:hypothetical protein